MTTRLNAKAIAPDAYKDRPFRNIQTLRRIMNATVTTVKANRISTASLATMFAAATLLAAWRRRAADRRQLARLDGHMLRDIGLSLGDVDIEVSKPFWRA